MTRVESPLKTQLTGTGFTDSVSGTTTSVKISGTFVGTINIQLLDLWGQWIDGTDQSDAVIAITEPRVWVVDTGFAEQVRVNCSAFTSGPINVDIQVNKI